VQTENAKHPFAWKLTGTAKQACYFNAFRNNKSVFTSMYGESATKPASEQTQAESSMPPFLTSVSHTKYMR